MRRLYPLIGALLVGVLVAPAAAPAHSPRFTVDSPFIRDRFGRAVFFHGVNAVWKVDRADIKGRYYPPSSEYPPGFSVPAAGSYFDERDAQLLESLGLNTVRLGIIWKGLEPKRDWFDETYLDRIEDIANVLGRHGVTVMLDFHQDMANERFQGEGWPDWATHTEVVPNQGIPGATIPTGDLVHLPDEWAQFHFPFNYFTPPVQQAFDNLWRNNFGLWAEYRDAWRHVAARFADTPNVVGYDLLNEPWPITPWESCAQTEGCPVFDTQFLQPFYESVITGIRAADPDGIVWWEPHVVDNDGAANNVGLLKPIYDPGANQGIAFHTYCLLGGEIIPGLSREADPECPVGEEYTFRQQREAADRNGSALFLTEFGASQEIADIARVADMADRSMVNWHYWHYGNWFDPTGNPPNEGMFDDDLDRTTLRPERADALSRTYPQAVAGTPGSFFFDSSTKTFTLEFEADPSIEQPTRIFVPVARHYGGHYAVSVSGPASQTSAADAPYLTLTNTGAGPVTVTVTKL